MSSRLSYAVGYVHKGCFGGKHEWDLKVLVLKGKHTSIERVEIHADDSLRSSPLSVCSGHETGTWSAEYGATYKAKSECSLVVRIVNRDNFTTEAKLLLKPWANSLKDYPDQFMRAPQRQVGRKTVVPLPKKITFGIELELSDENGTSRSTIAKAIEKKVYVGVEVVREYRNAHKQHSDWKLVHDGSIVCGRNAPNCKKFELVSPILRGEQDLETCYKVLKTLTNSSKTSIAVNRSMGFHVHVSVAGLPLQDLKKICLNFVKFEDAMDSFMAPSRRTGGSASDAFCKSCKTWITNPGGTIAALNGGRHRAIVDCK